MASAAERAKSKSFVQNWKNRGDEKQDTQTFWLTLLRDVLGVEQPEKLIDFEFPVKVSEQEGEKGTTKYADAYIAKTRVLIEQKSLGVDLGKATAQSGGALLTPYMQARRYDYNLPQSQRAKWIVTCNFQEFRIYKTETPNAAPEVVYLKDLVKDRYRLDFLVNPERDHVQSEMDLSLEAGKLVGKIYDALRGAYHDPDSPETLKALNILCVRLVFCLYAEDAEIFGRHNQFHDYLQAHRADARQALKTLFQVLDQRHEERDPYLEDDLKAFPYVNGGLFADAEPVIPPLSDAVVDLILKDASAGFDWSGISPTIFGAVFESTLNPETRHAGGMHYTSVENIHKVIDPLFLSDLCAELEALLAQPESRKRSEALKAFQTKLSKLTFLDPACGSGNFLTETYLSLRRLENRVLNALQGGQGELDMGDAIHVSIQQFYGIEINDFAVKVAQTALWISESQMMRETSDILHRELDFFPLKNYANLHEGNALQVPWEEVCPPDKLSYIIGNPPFLGARVMGKEQKADMLGIFGKDWKNVGNIDYVGAWYKRATDYMKGTDIEASLVATNSITQGEQVANLWCPLFAEGIHINFAHRTFRWDSEASLKAHVHVVIVSFSFHEREHKYLFEGGQREEASHINAYLLDKPDIFVYSRDKALCDVPVIGIGNQPIDGGNYLFEKDEMEAFIRREPKSAPYFRPWYGAEEFIHQKPRYCLWLGDCSPREIKEMPLCYERVENVRALRRASKRPETRKLADTPTRFQVENMPDGDSIILPAVSSEKRDYVPMGFFPKGTFASNRVFLIPSATLYHFGVLESRVHMAWMRAVCGRLKSDYNYSKDIVYNNFPWCTPSEELRREIEASAQAILDARALYPDSSLEDLYNRTLMPPEIRKAHERNDRLVMKAYGFDPKMDESACVIALVRMYEELVAKERKAPRARKG